MYYDRKIALFFNPPKIKYVQKFAVGKESDIRPFLSKKVEINQYRLREYYICKENKNIINTDDIEIILKNKSVKSVDNKGLYGFIVCEDKITLNGFVIEEKQNQQI